ncbi:flagellar hook-basal body complex protein FliE [Pikeienuella piscinae]|uniref:Flagellar hook-basal body complex protein FliE n=1 Tax=Pikeienuella piscinae TaxID=2748098 RepID=A0A7L5BYI4_9RHOB|nr:flagellar hook-basal body complex protein FliE [Pikeienuella piscinae]QIE56985.1 flagellar hook-basal body complex protein FliE [Pikeienuella piscinae]
MEVNSALASRFYQNVQGALRPEEGVRAASGPGETALNAARSFVETLRQGEQVAEAGMVGRADPQSVVTALASAEIALQSAVSIRDKVVESYQEILRMPV